MEIIGKYGEEDLAILYIAKMDNGRILEFVESTQPPIPREKKWVLIISTMFGCPIQCMMCDAGEYYIGNATKEQMFAQIDFLIRSRFPNTTRINIPKFKIQFARMGEPVLNMEVLEVIKELKDRYDAPGLMPCISTVAPKKGAHFLDQLIPIKDELYSNGNFQLQFSIHSTDENLRQRIMAKNIWTLEEIAAFGEKWYKPGDRKITLNFAVAKDFIINVEKIQQIFDPKKYLIKITPLNPTNKAQRNNLHSSITQKNAPYVPLIEEFETAGFETLLSIGEWKENKIGTNCGQFATKFEKGKIMIKLTYETAKYKL